VIHYDPWWNPAVEDQATGRAHRIGQLNPVFVYKLYTEGTVEQKILALQERKRIMAASVLGDGEETKVTLTAEDLSVMFEPLS
jgi:SNF2 family DNA or RNA helicase